MSRRALGAVLALGAALVLTGPAPPAAAAACSGSSGVTVVVDFGSQGGIQVGCAAGDPSSGLSALHSAGFSATGTQKDGPAFVCRINGAPAADRCIVTSPANAYWSYWHGSRGGSWTYSTLGAARYNPPSGSVEGWSFGAGARPGIAPPAAPAPPAPKPAPKPTVAPPVAPRPSTPGGAPGPTRTSGAPAPGPGAPAAGSTRSSTGATASRSGAAPSTSDSSSAGATSSGPSAVAGVATEDPGPPGSVASDPAPAPSSRRTVGALALGGALVLGLGTAGILVARRRRTFG